MGKGCYGSEGGFTCKSTNYIDNRRLLEAAGQAGWAGQAGQAGHAE